jgi:hypothetical protein
MHPAGNFKFAEGFQLVAAWDPVDVNSTAQTGDIVSLENYQRCAVVVHAKAGSATTGDITLTIVQCTDVSNSLADAKALNFTRIDVKQGADSAAIGQFTATTQTAANTYTSATSGEADLIWVVDFGADELDIANDFDCIRASLGATSSAKVVGCMYVLYGAKYGTDPLPSAIVD